LTVDRVTDKDVSINWRAPKSDGGSRIKQYKVYKKSDKPGSVWTDAGTVDSFKTNATITGLSPDEKYTFAVMAENEMGLGEMAETDRPTVLQKPLSMFSSKVIQNKCLEHKHYLFFSFNYATFITFVYGIEGRSKQNVWV
jgi:hypothetical protein